MDNKKRIIVFVLFAGMVLGFSELSEALTGSITDTFIDESMIAFKENIEIDTIAGQAKTPTYSWYATFTHGGNNYAWSSSKTNISWNTVIPGYSNSMNPGGYSDGYTGAKGQDWCNNTFITSGPEDDFNDWFIPSAYELQSGRTYSGSNPWSGVNNIWSSSTPTYYGDWDRALVRYESMTLTGIDARALKAGNNSARPVRIITALNENLVSTNLLAGENVSSIDSFGYDVSSLPGGTSLKVQFSQDNTNWYNSSGTLNGWDTLIAGTDTISLASLSWVDPNFYYRMEFGSNALITYAPVLDEISVNYTLGAIPEPASLLLLGFGVLGVALFKKRIS